MDCNDPHVSATHHMRRWGDLGTKSVHLSPAAPAGYDCVLIATNHAATDWQFVSEHAKLVVDTRNAMAKIKQPKARVVKA